MDDMTETTKGDRGQLQLSVVVPLLDEEDNLPALYEQITRALEGRYEYEIVFVDDGSTDGSFQILKDLHASDPRVRVIRFRRNFGQTAASSAGFAHARGEVIVAMDADLQNDPADIPMLVAKLDEGYDVVSGWRKKRQDKALTRRLPSRIANWLISRITDVKLHDYGCTLKAYRREVLAETRLYGEMHRFIPALASWSGATGHGMRGQSPAPDGGQGQVRPGTHPQSGAGPDDRQVPGVVLHQADLCLRRPGPVHRSDGRFSSAGS